MLVLENTEDDLAAEISSKLFSGGKGACYTVRHKPIHGSNSAQGYDVSYPFGIGELMSLHFLRLAFFVRRRVYSISHIRRRHLTAVNYWLRFHPEAVSRAVVFSFQPARLNIRLETDSKTKTKNCRL